MASYEYGIAKPTKVKTKRSMNSPRKQPKDLVRGWRRHNSTDRVQQPGFPNDPSFPQ
jgi:hypothetical protein